MLPILYTTPLSNRALTHIFFSFFCFAAALLLLIHFFCLFLICLLHRTLGEPIDRVDVTFTQPELDYSANRLRPRNLRTQILVYLLLFTDHRRFHTCTLPDLH